MNVKRIFPVLPCCLDVPGVEARELKALGISMGSLATRTS